MHRLFALSTLVILASPLPAQRARARDLGVKPGVFSPGPLNSITDVRGVKVGHATVIEGDSVRTGITAILPLQRFFYRQLMYAALLKSVATAVQGLRAGWGKLERSASVVVPETGVRTQEI